MSQAEELRHQASSSSHEVDQDQEEGGQLGDQMEEVSNKTLLRLHNILRKSCFSIVKSSIWSFMFGHKLYPLIQSPLSPSYFVEMHSYKRIWTLQDLFDVDKEKKTVSSEYIWYHK